MLVVLTLSICAELSHSYSCEGYPACPGKIWLPGCLQSVALSEAGGSCARCGPAVKLLALRYVRTKIPAYMAAVSEAACPLCDDDLR
jgi:hypothetical protein